MADLYLRLQIEKEQIAASLDLIAVVKGIDLYAIMEK